MAGRVLTANVVVRDPQDGSPVCFDAGSVPPDWAKDLLGAHLFEEPTASVAPPGGPSEVPPKAGAGSGAKVWKAYAETHGLTVPDGASREDIIEACEKAGVPTD